MDVPTRDAYGLSDDKVLQVAVELAPALFGALRVANSLEASHFPLASDRDLLSALRAVANKRGTFETDAVTITASDVKDGFPEGFLPVNDKLDLIRKIYLAIIIAHRERSSADLQAARADKNFRSSHPLDLEAL